MGKKFRNIVIGIVLIVLAVICGLASFYLLEVKPELQRREETQLTQPEVPQPISPSERTESISLQTVLKESQAIYPPQEKNKSEGLLWVDKKSDKLIVTLGAINGLSEGSVLSIYDGPQRIGEAKVKTVLDTISYVEPQEQLKTLLQGDYYQVKIE